MVKTLDNSGKYALVTGSSSGMGLEYVKLLAARGYNIIIVALFQNETDAVKEELSREYPALDIMSIGIDLSLPNSAEALYEKVGNLPIEVLINNAGVLYPYHFSNMTAKQIGTITMIHNYTLTLMCHYFSKGMVERGKGYILNVSSLAAWFPYPFISMYSATKAYTKTFTRAFRTEMKGTGVEVSTIYFGAVCTNLYHISSRLTKLALNFGVMITAQRAAKRALKMMFSGRSGWIPGFVNKFALLIAAILPHSLVNIINRKVTKKWNLK